MRLKVMMQREVGLVMMDLLQDKIIREKRDRDRDRDGVRHRDRNKERENQSQEVKDLAWSPRHHGLSPLADTLGSECPCREPSTHSRGCSPGAALAATPCARPQEDRVYTLLLRSLQPPPDSLEIQAEAPADLTALPTLSAPGNWLL